MTTWFSCRCIFSMCCCVYNISSAHLTGDKYTTIVKGSSRKCYLYRGKMFLYQSEKSSVILYAVLHIVIEMKKKFIHKFLSIVFSSCFIKKEQLFITYLKEVFSFLCIAFFKFLHCEITKSHKTLKIHVIWLYMY